MPKNRFEIETIFKGKNKISAPLSKMRASVGRFIRKVKSGFSKATRVIGFMTKSIFALGKRMALFGLIALGAIGLMLKKFADAGDKLAKFSRRVGIGVESLQEWRFAAGLAGIEAEAFDKSIEKLAKGIGEARAGTGTMVTLLKKTNPELLRQLLLVEKTEDALLLGVDALRKTTNAQDKAALSTALFGRAGTKMINLSENTTKALADQRKEARALGLITEGGAKDSELFNDALLRAQMALIGIRNVIGEELLPVLTPMIDKFKEFAIDLRPKVQAFAKEFAAKLPERINKMIGFFKELLPLGKRVFEGMKNAAADIDLNDVVDKLGNVLDIMDKLATAVGLIADSFGAIGGGVGKLAGATEALFAGRFQGFGQDELESDITAPTFVGGTGLGGFEPAMVSPQERITRSIEETRETREDRLIIENQSQNPATLNGGKASKGNVELINTGTFEA